MLSSYLTIRKLIGTLGILLPILVYVGHGELLSSISHYYYTKSAVFFIAILTCFGLFLISYKGYEKAENEWLSDDIITRIGGFCALLVVLLPTTCFEDDCGQLSDIDLSNGYLFGHANKFVGIIHLVSAGIFLIAMGWMSINRFTKGSHKLKNKFYKFCGYTVWASIGILIVLFALDALLDNFSLPTYSVYIFETIAVTAFGSSWLVKGKAIEDVIELKNKMFNTVKK